MRKKELSFLGRISTIKMMVLPKRLFLFQNLPILTPYKILMDLEKDIRKFIWGKKTKNKN